MCICRKCRNSRLSTIPAIPVDLPKLPKISKISKISKLIYSTIPAIFASTVEDIEAHTFDYSGDLCRHCRRFRRYWSSYIQLFRWSLLALSKISKISKAYIFDTFGTLPKFSKLYALDIFDNSGHLCLHCRSYRSIAGIAEISGFWLILTLSTSVHGQSCRSSVLWSSLCTSHYASWWHLDACKLLCCLYTTCTLIQVT